MPSNLMKLRLTYAGLGMAVAALGVTVTSVAARAPVDDMIYACYVPTTGTVYRIKLPDTRQACTSDRHVPFSWNASGPPGPPGPQGEAGPAGAPGAAGGVSGYEIVTAQFGPMTDRFFLGTVSCPPGKRALGGGATAATTNPLNNVPPWLTSSNMTVDGSGWSGKGTSVNANPWTLDVSVICANVTL